MLHRSLHETVFQVVPKLRFEELEDITQQARLKKFVDWRVFIFGAIRERKHEDLDVLEDGVVGVLFTVVEVLLEALKVAQDLVIDWLLPRWWFWA